MKQILNIFAFALLSFMIISCEKDEDQAVIHETTQGKVSTDKTSIVLDKNNPDETALSVTWTKSTFDLSVVSTQQVQFGIKGKSFAGASSTDAVNSPTTFTHKQLNAIALGLGATPDVPVEIEVRLRTKVGEGGFYSNVITMNITPYFLGPVYNYTDLYLIGDATAAGWTNEVTNTKFLPLQKSATAGAYSYTGYFAQGNFKIIKTPGNWDVQYGLGGSAGTLSTDGGSGNINVATAGYYKLTINTTALTYSLVPITPPTSAFTSISMIGSASGDWNTDVDLQKNTFDAHIWVKKNVELKAGEFKFRANHDWGTNWGTAQEFFGVGDIGGGNIPVSTQFNYDVYFNDITGEFSFIPLF
ncbi:MULTISPECIES: SusE domain-containing protein [unclassified Chryseobacterium]|uniref:SusE domain-containing protein n=1 Tax=unclassified Chryseobacterium TaxID=2593645 RepID=UPI002269F1F4|nr:MULTISPECIES: SusE domain-containing protein [unclassified Chryseobacterium]